MNSPFVQEQAKKLAAAAERESSPSARSVSAQAENRVRLIYRRALGRSPDGRELALGVSFLQRQESASGSLSSLAQLAQVLMLTNEFMFVD
jgi:hypothetical protein